MQDIFEEWLKELESEEILVKGVVLQPSRLKEFLNRKVEVQEFLIAESRKEEHVKEFLEALNRKK
ncbi:MAG: hypothetical protein QXI42_03540 [Thermoproteota archaeon]